MPFASVGRSPNSSLFGSVLRDDFGPESDMDVLVRFEEEARHSLLFDLSAYAKQELKADIRTREVDIGRAGAAIERSRNFIRRRSILQTAAVVYTV